MTYLVKGDLYNLGTHKTSITKYIEQLEEDVLLHLRADLGALFRKTAIIFVAVYLVLKKRLKLSEIAFEPFLGLVFFIELASWVFVSFNPNIYSFATM
jgi:hypothetical protein